MTGERVTYEAEVRTEGQRTLATASNDGHGFHTQQDALRAGASAAHGLPGAAFVYAFRVTPVSRVLAGKLDVR